MYEWIVRTGVVWGGIFVFDTDFACLHMVWMSETYVWT